MEKIIVFGLDGGTWNVIKPLIEKGELKVFKKLMDNGTWGAFNSTYPPGTVPAWPAMLTGKKPELLNAFDFFYRHYNAYKPSLNDITFDDSLWRILNRYDKKCFIFNIPLTQLSNEQDIKGLFIAGPILNVGEFTNNDELRRIMKRIGYRINPFSFNLKPNVVLENIIQHSIRQFAFINKVINQDWDLLFYVNYFTDQVSHLYWKYIDIDHPDYINDKEILSLFIKFYKIIDNFLSLLIKNSTHLFIVSDHGFGPLFYNVNLNKWLEKQGFLTLKKKQPITHENKKDVLNKFNLYLLRLFLKIENSSDLLYEILLKLYRRLDILQFLSSKLGFQSSFTRDQEKVIVKAPFFDYIDWTKTQAYCIHSKGININKSGREPLGIINSKEYDYTREEIIKRLKKLRDPNGNPVVESAWKVEDMYDNPSMNAFPDIILKYKDHSKYRNVVNSDLELNNQKLFYKDKHSGTHIREGIFIAYGRDIKKGYRMEQIQIYDLVPTILHLFSIPISEYMQGEVLKEIFIKNSEFELRNVVYDNQYSREEKIIKIKAEKFVKKL